MLFVQVITYPWNTGNYYTDACLLAAGNRPLGKLDFYQIHSYGYNGQWGSSKPFKVPKLYLHHSIIIYKKAKMIYNCCQLLTQGVCLLLRIRQASSYWWICFGLRSRWKYPKPVPIRIWQRISGIPFINKLIYIVTIDFFSSKGVWSWQYNAGGECSDTQATQDAGMAQLKNQNGAGGAVNFPLGFW